MLEKSISSKGLSKCERMRTRRGGVTSMRTIANKFFNRAASA